jgi:hypothetical protein
MPLKHKIGVPKKCNICLSEDESKFSSCIYDICKECKKLKNSKVYLCKYCKEDNPNNFYEGRYSTCKKCRNKSESEKIIINEPSESKNIKDCVYKSIFYDNSVFNGMSLIQLITNLSERIETLENENEEIKKENFDLKSEINKLKFSIIENNGIIFRKIGI